MFYRVPLIKSLNSKKDIKYNGQKDENKNDSHGQQSIKKQGPRKAWRNPSPKNVTR
jgi:hypothetical protein